jgi:hypothetical protein
MHPKKQKVVLKYISLEFSNLVEITDYEGVHDSRFWVYKKSENPLRPVIEFDNERNLWIKEEIWRDIQKMFPLTYNQVQKSIKIWAKENWGLQRINPIRDRML